MTWDRKARQYAAFHDPYFASPLTAEMVASYIANCPPPPDVTVVAALPPAWVNTRPGPCTCGYCRGIITHSRHDRPTQYIPVHEYEAVET